LIFPYRKDVEFAGYSIPHPLDKALNLRVQTTGASPYFDFNARIIYV